MSKTGNLTERLRNLEALVSSFAAQELVIQQRRRTEGDKAANDHATSTASAEEPTVMPSPSSIAHPSSESVHQKGLNPETPRIRQTHDGHVNFVDSSHWLSVLEDIREVREHLSPTGSIPAPDVPKGSGASWDPEPPEVSSVLGLEASITLGDILTSLPPRPICDRLLSLYFNSRFQVLGECSHLKGLAACCGD